MRRLQGDEKVKKSCGQKIGQKCFLRAKGWYQGKREKGKYMERSVPIDPASKTFWGHEEEKKKPRPRPKKLKHLKSFALSKETRNGPKSSV